ncbi:MAG: ATP-binding protein [Anaerolineae bacterium]|nr:ATP-binding protein [Anaerolineae bacterium]
MSFIGRKWELDQLEEQYQRPKATFLIVYGRRRVGKTRLLMHWWQSRSTPTLYWVATQTTAERLLASFSEAVYRHIHGHLPNHSVTHRSWEDAFEELAKVIESRSEKTTVIIDEFTYASGADTSLPSVIQKVWDHRLQFLPIFLVISGSHVGMMERDVIAYRAPLYGRATGRLHLSSLPFKELAGFFPKYDVVERVAVHAVLGGIPFYLEQFDPELTVSENIKRRVMGGINLLQEEPRLLLHEQVQEPRQYINLLQAIANGNHTLADIALEANMERPIANKYLTTLSNLEIVGREIPATVRDPDKSRRGRYVINDPYLRFYFRFIHPRMSDITAGMTTDVLANIREHMTGFVGKYAFEELCRKWVQIAGGTGKLPFSVEVIGSHWSRTEEIDVVAVNWRSHDILFGECKWSPSEAISAEIVDKLFNKSQKVIPVTSKDKPFNAHYVFFGRAGFTPDGLKRIKEIKGIPVDLALFEEVLNMAVR